MVMALTQRFGTNLFNDPFFSDIYDPFQDFGREVIPRATARDPWWMRRRFPVSRVATDMTETSDSYLVEAEVPGFTRDEIKIEMDENNRLVLRGDKTTQEKSEGDWIYAERQERNSFTRSLLVPGSVKVDKISATMENGILKVNLPKEQGSKRKMIQIQ